MKTFSNSLRTFVWLCLCVFMGIGMIVFAIIYAIVSFIARKIAWKEVSLPSVRIAK